MTELLGWPPHWALAVAVGILVVASAWIVSSRRASNRNRSLENLRDTLEQSGLEYTPEAFAVSGEETALLISGERVAVLDLVEPKLVRTYSLFQIEALKIYDDKEPKAVDFCFELRGGARSRRIRTASMPEFCRLFDYMQRAERPVHFIAE